MSKVRDSNIELLRIVAMILVLFLHSNYFSLGGVELYNIQTLIHPSYIRALAEQLCIICVNLYVFISGWFGIKPSIKGVLSLLFQVLFFHILISIIVLCIGATFSIKEFIKVSQQPFVCFQACEQTICLVLQFAYCSQIVFA